MRRRESREYHGFAERGQFTRLAAEAKASGRVLIPAEPIGAGFIDLELLQWTDEAEPRDANPEEKDVSRESEAGTRRRS